MKYQLKLEPEHANILVKALDLYSRILCFQFEEVATVLRYSTSIRFDIINDLENKLKEVSRSVGGQTGIIGPHVNSKAQIAYDVQQVLRNLIAKEEDHHAYSVWHGKPLQTSKVPLPEGEII